MLKLEGVLVVLVVLLQWVYMLLFVAASSFKAASMVNSLTSARQYIVKYRAMYLIHVLEPVICAICIGIMLNELDTHHDPETQ